MKQRSRRIVAVAAGAIVVTACILLIALFANSARTAGAGENRASQTRLQSPSDQGERMCTLPSSAPTVRSCVDLQMLLPLYSYPCWWDPDCYIWDDVAAASSRIRITAIINPGNGPGGSCPNPDYERGLQDLRNAGIPILGYVDTGYGNRPIEDVKRDIDLYNQPCYDIHGIFFDQVFGGSCSAELCDYYQELYDYVKSCPNLDIVICNPGTKTDECYFSRPACDTAVIFEGFSGDWPGYEPCSYVTAYPADRSAMIVHSVPDCETAKSHIDLAVARNIGYVYVTDDTLSNPYDSLPAYWTCEVDYIWWSNGCKAWLPLIQRDQ